MVNINAVMLGGSVSNFKPGVTKNGKTFLKLTLTTWKQHEEKDDVPMFHNVVFYAGKADAILKYVKEKEPLIVSCQIEYRNNANGETYTSLVGTEFFFCG